MRRRPVARWSALAVGAVALVFVAVLATRQPALMVTANSPLIGKPAPAIVAKSFSGRTVSLASMKGRWVLVNFFASWCDACQSEEPQLEQFLYSHPAGPASQPEVLGVLYGDSVSNGRSFQTSQGATWPAVIDPNGAIAVNYGVGSLPRSYLVDPQGKVEASIVGPVTVAGLTALIQHEIAEGN